MITTKGYYVAGNTFAARFECSNPGPNGQASRVVSMAPYLHKMLAGLTEAEALAFCRSKGWTVVAL